MEVRRTEYHNLISEQVKKKKKCNYVLEDTGAMILVLEETSSAWQSAQLSTLETT